MRVDMLTVGVFQSNCFIVSCEETKEAIIVDAGDEAERILDTVTSNNFAVKCIFNTHSHIDHVTALADVVAALEVPVLMHEAELPVYESLPQQAAMFGLPATNVAKIDRFIRGGDALSFGKLTGHIIDTPGHSPGGVSLRFDDEGSKCIFVGDVLFRGSIGRTDLFGANHTQMIETLRNVIMELPDNMVVYPGHGPETTIGLEKQTNPFLLQLG